MLIVPNGPTKLMGISVHSVSSSLSCLISFASALGREVCLQFPHWSKLNRSILKKDISKRGTVMFYLVMVLRARIVQNPFGDRKNPQYFNSDWSVTQNQRLSWWDVFSLFFQDFLFLVHKHIVILILVQNSFFFILVRDS